jgi:hypothetical protein
VCPSRASSLRLLTKHFGGQHATNDLASQPHPLVRLCGSTGPQSADVPHEEALQAPSTANAWLSYELRLDMS